MKAFRFPLDKVLNFRKRQWEAASAELAVRLERYQKLLREHTAAVEAFESTARALQSAPSIESGRIQGFALAVESGRRAAQRLQHALDAAARQVDQQRGRCVEAKRQYELLRRLRQARKSVWQKEADREEEALSTEIYLAHCIREKAASTARARTL
jgi:flagellar export protein FliJ